MQNPQYKKDLNHTYLMIPWEGAAGDYRIHMLQYHRMKELLPCMLRRVDRQSLLTYEVNDRQPLGTLFQNRAMGHESLRGLIRTLSEALEHMNDYLLDGSMLLLDPDYIFGEEEKESFWFCCHPGRSEDVFEEFHKLCGYLLQILDHRDEQAVQLGYSLYRTTMEKKCGLSGLLQEWDGTESENPKPPEGSKEPEALYEKKKKAPVPQALHPERKEYRDRREGRDQKEYRDWKESRDQRENREQKEYRESKGNREQKEYRESKENREQDRTRRPEKRMGFFKSRRQAEEKKGFFGLPSYAREELFVYGKKSCILQSTNRKDLVFAPASFPFLLGSLSFGVDGCIDDVTVSRFHARIQEQDDGYSVTDLHSGEGTWVNGRKLPAEIPQKLANGDKLRLGGVEFVFLYKNEEI